MPDLPVRPPCCCSSKAECAPKSAPETSRPERTEPYLDGWIESSAGPVPRLSTRLSASDRRGALKMRWGMGRDRYAVLPGLYAAGAPDAQSPVLVTANYKLTVDRLRSRLSGFDAWILILDTKGINVWCAAGKGTFGTDELEHQIRSTRLDAIVAHRKLILPQLGAPGVSAHEIAKRTGFHVNYGPVRVQDLPAYLRSGFQATEEMRRVRFDVADRLRQVPVELTTGLKYLAPAVLILALMGGAAALYIGFGKAVESAAIFALCGILAYLAAGILTLILLPWLPGRAFSLKGVWIGLGLSALCGLFFTLHPGATSGTWTAAGWMVLFPTLTSFIAMNFTGSTPFTSLSGVRYEMRRAVPLQVIGAVSALGLWIAGVFVR